MDLENMTLKDFIEYAEIYEYSQERFEMEKMFMELNLIGLHLESYEFLMENDVSIGQLDCLMVESGINDKSIVTESAFFEKGGNIFEGIKKMFVRIGKAIAAFFRKIGRIFTGKNKEVETVEKKNEEQRQALQELGNLVTNTDTTAGVANETINQIQDQLQRILAHIDQRLGGGGAQALPVAGVDHNSAITVVVEFASKASKVSFNEQQMAVYTNLLKPEYEVNGLQLIAMLETLTDEIKDVIDLSEEGDSAVAYNSAKKLHALGTGYLDKVNNLRNKIEVSVRKSARFTLSEEVLNKKIETAEKLNQIFAGLARYTNVGAVDKTNFLANEFDRRMTASDEQLNNAAEAKNNAAIRAKKDDDMKYKVNHVNAAGARKLVGRTMNKQQFLNNYMVYMNALNKLAVTLQSAVAEMTKAMTAHMQLRNAVISAHKSVTASVDSVISASKQAA